jgi:hypothetical protein
MSMYPDEATVEIDGEEVSYPGLKDGKFTDGSFSDPEQKPSFIPAATVNLLVDNIAGLISGLGKTPDNASASQLATAVLAVLPDLPNGTYARAARTLSAYNFNTLIDTGFYLWSNAETTNYPDGCAAADVYALRVISGPVGSGTIIQNLSDVTQGPGMPKYSWIRQSVNGGTTWTTWMSAVAPPIGEVYFRGPHDLAPSAKYPGTTWTDVSYEEANLGRRVAGDLAGGMFTGTPARLSVAVSSGVPTISIVSGGSGYLSGGSGTINLIIAGACTTPMVATATVTSGVLTVINVTTAGVGYTSGAVAVYDGVVGHGDLVQNHYHYRNTDNTAERRVVGASTQYRGDGGLDPINTGNVTYTGGTATFPGYGAIRGGAETAGAWIAVSKYRRTA